MAAGHDHAQGRCRLLSHGGETRLCRARGAQGRRARRQGRPDRNEGAAVRRGRQLRRRLRRHRRVRARRRRETARLQLARRALCHARPPRHRPDRGPARQVRCRLVAGHAARHGGAGGAGVGQGSPGRGQDRRRRRRSGSLHRAAGRRGGRRGGVQRIPAVAGGEEHARAGGGAPDSAPVPALLHAR